MMMMMIMKIEYIVDFCWSAVSIFEGTALTDGKQVKIVSEQ